MEHVCRPKKIAACRTAPAGTIHIGSFRWPLFFLVAGSQNSYHAAILLVNPPQNADHADIILRKQEKIDDLLQRLRQWEEKFDKKFNEVGELEASITELQTRIATEAGRTEQVSFGAELLASSSAGDMIN